MWKHLLLIFAIAATAFGVVQWNRAPAGPDAEFRCRLPDIQCDSCREAVKQALKDEDGIRKVRFEGEDGKELVITHAADRTPASLGESLKRVGYPPEALIPGAKSVSHGQCVCPTEQAKAKTQTQTP